MIRSYAELITIPDYTARFEYLKLSGVVAEETFGYDRFMNQELYRSKKWKSFRSKIIYRDNACDLGCIGYDIHSGILIHHINPLTRDDIINQSSRIFDFNNVITTCFNTHQAIHYGSSNTLQLVTERKPNDTIPWR